MLLCLTWRLESGRQHLLKTLDCLPLAPFPSRPGQASPDPAFPQLVSHESSKDAEVQEGQEEVGSGNPQRDLRRL